MDSELDKQLILMYGNRLVPCLQEVKTRLDMVVTALLYAGNQGNNPLCEINKLFERIGK
jgi:hypothetical protein